MTVKKLTQAQKDAVVTIYNHNAKTIKDIAGFLGVSTRTIGRVLDESVYVSSAPQRSDEANKVMALLYRHNLDAHQLGILLSIVMRMSSVRESMATQTTSTKKSPSGHVGKQVLLPLNFPNSLEL